jgi:non-ribosomal peptide synthetase component E (peptide arylation enzyme)
MNKAHLTLFALLVAGATVLGAVAVTRTTGLGRAARQTNDAAVVAQTKQLSAYAAKLKKELKAKPPALPPVPKASPAASQSQAPHVVYQQPPPVVTVIHRHHADDGSEGGGGRDD